MIEGQKTPELHMGQLCSTCNWPLQLDTGPFCVHATSIYICQQYYMTCSLQEFLLQISGSNFWTLGFCKMLHVQHSHAQKWILVTLECSYWIRVMVPSALPSVWPWHMSGVYQIHSMCSWVSVLPICIDKCTANIHRGTIFDVYNHVWKVHIFLSSMLNIAYNTLSLGTVIWAPACILVSV